jgi:hypothetical protein
VQRQLILDSHEVVTIPRDEARSMADFMRDELKAIAKDRWHRENPNKVERKIKLEQWIRILERLA